MIDALHGSVVRIEEQRILFRAGSFVLDVQVSARTADFYRSLGPEDRRECRMLTFLLHREDSMILYGFRDEAERTIFHEIIKVQGIGPKQAVKILSGIGPDDFIRALDTGDLTQLTAVPGLGTKTAQKIMLALRGKLAFTAPKPAGAAVDSVWTQSFDRQLVQEIIQSLSEMGYDKRDVRTAVDRTIAELGTFVEGSREEVEKRIFTAALIRLG